MNPSENRKQSNGNRQGGDVYVLTLYIAGQSPRSKRAIENLRRIGQEYLEDQYEVEVIDIREDPDAADRNDIVAIPTLIKRLPPPMRRVVGDLSRTEKVLIGLDIKEKN